MFSLNVFSMLGKPLDTDLMKIFRDTSMLLCLKAFLTGVQGAQENI